EDIPIARVLSLAPTLAKDSGGRFSGDVTFRSPANKLQDSTAWEVNGTARADRLRLLGTALEHASTKVKLEKGELSLTDTRAGVEGLEVTGSATLKLKESYPFQARLDLDRVDLAAIKRLAPG